MATVKGIWLFNETTDLSSLSYTTQKVNFTTAGYNCTEMYRGSDYDSGDDELCYVGIPNGFNLAYHSVGGHDGDKGWQDEAYRTVDFGETEQTVSDEFYTWLTANATQQKATPTLTYDLSQLNLSTGTYSITVVAKADGYGNSVRSNVVEYVVRGITVTELSATLPGYGACAAAITIGEKIWVFGRSAVHTFDYETKTLTTSIATLSRSGASKSLVAIGTKVYLFGGNAGTISESVTTINTFDTETLTNQTLSATLPTAAERIAAAAVGTKIYLFGGYHQPSQSYTDSYYELSTINVFDTETNTITTLNVTLPAAAYYIAATAVGTKIYLFGGQGDSYDILNTINVFDTETNTITTLDVTLPTGAWGIGSAAIGTKIYLFGGGLSGSSNATNTINVFDTKTNTLRTLDETIPDTASGIVAASVGKNIYLFGGSRDSSYGYNTITEVQT